MSTIRYCLDKTGTVTWDIVLGRMRTLRPCRKEKCADYDNGKCKKYSVDLFIDGEEGAINPLLLIPFPLSEEE